MFNKTQSWGAMGWKTLRIAMASLSVFCINSLQANWQLDSGASAGYLGTSGNGVGFSSFSDLDYSITTNSIAVYGYAEAAAGYNYGTWWGSSNRSDYGWASGTVVGKWNWTGAPGTAPSVAANVDISASGYVYVGGSGGSTYYQPGRYTAADAHAYIQVYADVETSSSYNSAYGSMGAIGWHNTAAGDWYDCYASAGAESQASAFNVDSYSWIDEGSAIWDASGDFSISVQTTYYTAAAVPSVEAYVSVYTTCTADSEAVTPFGVYAMVGVGAEAWVSGSAGIELDF